MVAASVESTTLAFIAYDASAQRLWLEFRSRAVYCYLGVPPAVHQALLDASSKGAYFNRSIRGRFPYQRESDALPQALRIRLHQPPNPFRPDGAPF